METSQKGKAKREREREEKKTNDERVGWSRRSLLLTLLPRPSYRVSIATAIDWSTPRPPFDAPVCVCVCVCVCSFVLRITSRKPKAQRIAKSISVATPTGRALRSLKYANQPSSSSSSVNLIASPTHPPTHPLACVPVDDGWEEGVGFWLWAVGGRWAVGSKSITHQL